MHHELPDSPQDAMGRSHRTFGKMTWPCPGERLDYLNWTLRYGEPRKEDLLLAASVISAYTQMVKDPGTKRQKVIAELRKGPN